MFSAICPVIAHERGEERMDSKDIEAARSAGGGAAQVGGYAPVDYSELSLMMQRAHQRADELAMQRDWLGAMAAIRVAKSCAYRLEDWFENASVGK